MSPENYSKLIRFKDHNAITDYFHPYISINLHRHSIICLIPNICEVSQDTGNHKIFGTTRKGKKRKWTGQQLRSKGLPCLILRNHVKSSCSGMSYNSNAPSRGQLAWNMLSSRNRGELLITVEGKNKLRKVVLYLYILLLGMYIFMATSEARMRTHTQARTHQKIKKKTKKHNKQNTFVV